MRKPPTGSHFQIDSRTVPVLLMAISTFLVAAPLITPHLMTFGGLISRTKRGTGRLLKVRLQLSLVNSLFPPIGSNIA